MAAEFVLWVRDSTLGLDTLIDDFISFQATERLNDAGTWSITMNYENADGIINPAVAAFKQYGKRGGIVLLRDGLVVWSGDVRRFQHNEGANGPTLTVYGWDDTSWLSARKVLPNPEGGVLDSGTGTRRYANGYYEITAAATAAMLDVVDKNMGPTALSLIPQRFLLGLVLPEASLAGPTITIKTRFGNLIEVLRQAAIDGGALRFRILQMDVTPNARAFQMYQPVDRRADVRFSRDLGNVTDMQTTDQAASANYIIAGAQGELTLREFVEGGDADSIAKSGLIEYFLDTRDLSAGTALAAVQARIASTLEAGHDSVSLTFTPLDEPYEYWRDYQLGDMVAVMVYDEETDGVVTEAAITLDDKGMQVKPFIATGNVENVATFSPEPRLDSTDTKVDFLQRNAEGDSWRMAKMWLGPIAEIPASYELLDGSDAAIGHINMAGRFPIGAGLIPGTAITTLLSDTGGVATLTTTELPSHTHFVTVGGTATAVSHVHTLTNGTASASAAGEAAHTHPLNGSGATTNPFTDPTHTHGTTGSSASTGTTSHNHAATGLTASTTSADAHSHGVGSYSALNETSPHSHAATGLTMVTENPAHSHGIAINSDPTGQSTTILQGTGTGVVAYTTTGAGAGHNHAINGNTGTESAGHTHVMTGATATGAHSHPLTGTSATEAAHNHAISVGGGTANETAHTHPVTLSLVINASAAGIYSHSHTLTGNTGVGVAHTHTITVGGATDAETTHQHPVTATGTSNPTGSGASGGNLPPYTAVWWIMRRR